MGITGLRPGTAGLRDFPSPPPPPGLGISAGGAAAATLTRASNADPGLEGVTGALATLPGLGRPITGKLEGVAGLGCVGVSMHFAGCILESGVAEGDSCCGMGGRTLVPVLRLLPLNPTTLWSVRGTCKPGPAGDR